MSKPEDIPQDVWDRAVHAAPWADYEKVARCFMAAKAEEREACARIADSYVDPIDIAHHIRKREG